MLTVAYCRVSTEEQATEGYSIDGQTAKLTAYAEAHDLGPVTVITDPGRSGKNLDRPGLRRLIELVEAGKVRAVLLWRLDRLSRDLGDIITLRQLFELHGVEQHFVTESHDLTSASGRMMFHFSGSIAQFYREQLAENVRMGIAQARALGRWTNRPPTGYDLVNGYLVPNAEAATILRIFEMRAQGPSQTAISEATGVNHSTLVSILRNRAYLGEIRDGRGGWLPGIHDPLITTELWDAARRGRTPGVKRGRDLMSGRVRCGTCGRKMSIQSNGQGQHQYRCKHRSGGCKVTGRSNMGLLRAAVLALGLLHDEELQDVIRRHLAERRQPDEGRRRRTPGAAETLEALREEQSKLLQLHYKGLIDDELLAREQARLRGEIENLAYDAEAVAADALKATELAAQFEEVLRVLEQLNIADLWPYATEAERRTVLDELVQHVTVHADRLTVHLHGAPPLNVAFSEVGLKDSELSRVGGGT